MLNAIGGDPERESANGRNGGIARGTICHHPGHRFDVGPPSSVFLLSYLDRDGLDCDGLHSLFYNSIMPKRAGATRLRPAGTKPSPCPSSNQTGAQIRPFANLLCSNKSIL